MLVLLPMTSFAKKAVLSQREAEVRSQQVSDLKYQVALDLADAPYRDGEMAPPEFRGTVVIDFQAKSDAKKVSDTLFLDFSGENESEVKSLFLNGNQAAFTWDEDRTRILIPSSLLKENSDNKIQIQFSSHYSRKGKGFHREVDQEDHEVYVYTNLEPFFANEVFPIFDQPDLKGTFQFDLTVPRNWIATANTRETQVTPLDSTKSLWSFSPTSKMSTYLIGISAGPFEIFEPKVKHPKVPFRLLAPKSLAKYVESDVWFDITRSSLDFYERHFGPYPYGKYDQIITPGTASSAMESLAAITFNVNYVSKGKMTSSQKTRLANTITHEMAHQWFGNLVTMKWWDDLWLNESFASFMASLVLSQNGKSLGLLDSWSKFFNEEKVSAYQADGYRTTHPIVMEVKDTLTGFSNFDSITYDKGASVLKQLYFYMGEEVFFRALQTYFRDFAESNATQSDFLNSLSVASGKDMSKWGESWLGRSGTNSVQVSFVEEMGGRKVLRATQLPDPFSGSLRAHQTLVGLYGLTQGGSLKLINEIQVQYDGAVTEIPIHWNGAAPSFVFPKFWRSRFCKCDFGFGINRVLVWKFVGN